MYACYCRVSSSHQKNASQKAEIQNWLRRHNIKAQQVRWFEDKETGKTLKRRTSTNKTCFLIASGYFSATKKFYSPQQFRSHDIEYVCRRLGENLQHVTSTRYDKQTILRHEEMILAFYGFKPFNLKEAPVHSTRDWRVGCFATEATARVLPRGGHLNS